MSKNDDLDNARGMAKAVLWITAIYAALLLPVLITSGFWD